MMRSRNQFFIALAILTFVVSGCKKEIVISEVPEITLVTVTPTSITEYQDSIVFEVYYRDGNGDLGENDPDAENLFIKDNRINVTHAYRISELAPTGSNIAIQGTLNVVLNNTGITDGSNQQTATFDVWVVDRANNQSNIETSSAITITK